jgi:hypothetical protein
MIQKTIGIYNDSSDHSPFNRDTLVVEVSKKHVVCLVKNEKDQKITALEFFKIEVEHNDWEDIFYELRTNSGLMDKSYNETEVFYHFDESVLIPAFKFSNNAVDGYLNLVFGEEEKSLVKSDSLNLNEESIYVSYRINQSLHDAVHRNFLSIKEQHIYSGLLKDLYSNEIKAGDNLYINFYDNQFIICAIKNKKLQLIQSIPFNTADDVLYQVLNIVKQFNFSTTTVLLSIAGMIDTNEILFKNLKQHFSHLFLTVADTETFDLEKLAAYPLHYFTPFFNLQA